MTVGYESDDGSWIFGIGVEKMSSPRLRRFHTGCYV